MPFSSNWFNTLAKNNFETYVKPFCTEKSHLKYLEIGSYEGASLLYMFENALITQESTATAIDPFNDFNNCYNQLGVFKSNLQPYLDRITILQSYSQIELPNMMPNTFDVIYIDGDHTSSAVLTDAELSFPLLKSGGIMIFDDYLWIHNGSHTNENINNPEIHNVLNPYTGINTFLKENAECIEVIVKNWQVIIKKK